MLIFFFFFLDTIQFRGGKFNGIWNFWKTLISNNWCPEENYCKHSINLQYFSCLSPLFLPYYFWYSFQIHNFGHDALGEDVQDPPDVRSKTFLVTKLYRN